jgi:hypothetical protein
MGDVYPNIEIEILICDGLDIESDCWNGCDDFSDLQSINCGCTGQVARSYL